MTRLDPFVRDTPGEGNASRNGLAVAMSQVVRFASIGLTFLTISLGWILFNLDSSAVQRSLGL